MGMQSLLAKVVEGDELTFDEAAHAFQIIMKGGATPAQMAAFLVALRIRGEVVDEIAGAATALRQASVKLDVPNELRDQLIDTCGTGGDGKGSYNISTTVALVVAACGVPVVKHGNKAVSSKSGSANVFTELGVNIDTKVERTLACLTETNICFMMAPHYHKAMRHVAPIRQELKLRTVFNLLGPLINPAMPKRQLMGVFSQQWVEPIAQVLCKLGATRAWVVHGSDGMDELTVTGKSYVSEVRDGEVHNFEISPEEVGLSQWEESELQGGDAAYNAVALREVLKGKEGAYRDMVLLNSAAALLVADKVDTIQNGVDYAAKIIDDGKAMDTLSALIMCSAVPEGEYNE